MKLRDALLGETPAFSGLAPPMSVHTAPFPGAADGWHLSRAMQVEP